MFYTQTPFFLLLRTLIHLTSGIFFRFRIHWPCNSLTTVLVEVNLHMIDGAIIQAKSNHSRSTSNRHVATIQNIQPFSILSIKGKPINQVKSTRTYWSPKFLIGKYQIRQLKIIAYTWAKFSSSLIMTISLLLKLILSPTIISFMFLAPS